MNIVEFTILFGYFACLILAASFSYKKGLSGAEFILGGRKANFWLTALSAQASDMGSWLFSGYPALIFCNGVPAAAAAIGLVMGMWINWHAIAPRLRHKTELFKSLTLNSYFESSFRDTSGWLRLLSSSMSILFFTIYISSGLMAMGILLHSLFGINYYLGTLVGLGIVVSYVFMGGYRTVAWIDLLQGCFLLIVVLTLPFYLCHKAGGLEWIRFQLETKQIALSFCPEWKGANLWTLFLTASGWGLGYFGQPHILTKFMGIRKTEEMWKAKYVGISWLVLALAAATFVGLLGAALVAKEAVHPEQIVLHLVQTSLSPLFAGLVLAAILAATTNVMAAHLLIVASNISEDFYRGVWKKGASSQELLWVSRCSVLVAAFCSLLIAYQKPGSIYHVVLYAWSGLGASFGPLVLFSLYLPTLHRFSAFAGIIVGGLSSAIAPYFDQELAPIIPGFLLGSLAILITSSISPKEESCLNLSEKN